LTSVDLQRFENMGMWGWHYLILKELSDNFG